MEKQQSGSEYRMLSSFSRDELYALVEEKGQVDIHLGGSWYGVLKVFKTKYLKEEYRHLTAAADGRIFVFSNHKGYDGDWADIIKREHFDGYKYADLVFYNRSNRCWIFPDNKVFPNGITLYDI